MLPQQLLLFSFEKLWQQRPARHPILPRQGASRPPRGWSAKSVTSHTRPSWITRIFPPRSPRSFRGEPRRGARQRAPDQGGAHSPARKRCPPPLPRRWLVRPLVLMPSIPIIFTTAGGAAPPPSGPVRWRGGRVPGEPPRGAREERGGPPSPRYGGGGCGARLVGLSMKVLRTRGGRGQAREWQGNGMGATMAMVPRHGLGLSEGGVCLTCFERCGNFLVGASVYARGKTVNTVRHLIDT